MRAGVLTFHKAYNYGAVLQCYALQNLLEKLGLETEIVDYVNERERDLRAMFPHFQKDWKLWFPTVIKNIVFYQKDKRRKEKFDNFLKTYLKISEPVQRNFDWNQYDLLITGSDQIWNRDITGGYDDFFFGNIPEYKGKKISYAASVGKFSEKEAELKQLRKLLLQFDKISVREEDTCLKLKKILKKEEVYHSIDPVLLVGQDFWKNLISGKKRQINEKYLFVYRVEKNDLVDKLAEDFAKQRNLKIATFRIRTRNNSKYQNCYESSPLEFVALIRDADMIVTSSFHATVFSLVFEKDFIVIPHQETGIRTVDLLKTMGLKKHLYTQKKILKSGQEKFTEEESGQMKKAWRKKQEESLGYLLDSLGLCEERK